MEKVLYTGLTSESDKLSGFFCLFQTYRLAGHDKPENLLRIPVPVTSLLLICLNDSTAFEVKRPTSIKHWHVHRQSAKSTFVGLVHHIFLPLMHPQDRVPPDRRLPLMMSFSFPQSQRQWIVFPLSIIAVRRPNRVPAPIGNDLLLASHPHVNTLLYLRSAP